MGFKGNKHKCKFRYVAVPMMTSEILKFVDFTKTQKSRYLKSEKFFLQTKKKFITHQGLLDGKKTVFVFQMPSVFPICNNIFPIIDQIFYFRDPELKHKRCVLTIGSDLSGCVHKEQVKTRNK